jgi:hypothetical protein
LLSDGYSLLLSGIWKYVHLYVLQNTYHTYISPIIKLHFFSRFDSVVDGISNQVATKESIHIYETLLLRVCAVHRLDPQWEYEDYQVTTQIYHGTRPIVEPMVTKFAGKTESFYERVKFDSW